MTDEVTSATAYTFVALDTVAGVIFRGSAHLVADATFASKAVVEGVSARLRGRVESR